MHAREPPVTSADVPPGIRPFLGGRPLVGAVGEGGAEPGVHGHVHRGVEHGVTAGGVRVRKVAQS
ncbi:hypothetical protein [Streptomyces sp. NPDC002187]|uniref:hypothetical protein n=1 Tax=Streptomyces sp. NPDC002187 TaxID=3364637 RepID=UPI0036834535